MLVTAGMCCWRNLLFNLLQNSRTNFTKQARKSVLGQRRLSPKIVLCTKPFKPRRDRDVAARETLTETYGNKKAQLTQRERATAVHAIAKSRKKSVKTSILVLKVIAFGVNRNPCMTSYKWLIVTLALSRTVSEIWLLLGWNPYPRGRHSRSRSSKVIDLGLNGKPIGDFLLVINCNLGPISHRFRDVASYGSKSQHFPTPPLI